MDRIHCMLCIRILYNRPCSERGSERDIILKKFETERKTFLTTGMQWCACRYMFVMISSKIGVAE